MVRLAPHFCFVLGGKGINCITNNHLIMRRFVKIALMTLLFISAISLVSCGKNNEVKDQQQDDQNSYVFNFVYSPEADKLTLKIESAEGKKDLNLYVEGDYCWDYHYIIDLLGKDANETCRTGVYAGVLGDFHAIEGEERKVLDNISSFVPLDIRFNHGVADFFETKARSFDINYYFKRTAAQAGIEN